MIALAAAVFVTFAALLIPNKTPFVRVWRPSFLMGALSAIGLMVTAKYFGFETMNPSVGLLYAGGLVAFLIGDTLMSTLMKPGHSSDPGATARLQDGEHAREPGCAGRSRHRTPPAELCTCASACIYVDVRDAMRPTRSNSLHALHRRCRSGTEGHGTSSR